MNERCSAVLAGALPAAVAQLRSMILKKWVPVCSGKVHAQTRKVSFSKCSHEPVLPATKDKLLISWQRSSQHARAGGARPSHKPHTPDAFCPSLFPTPPEFHRRGRNAYSSHRFLPILMQAQARRFLNPRAGDGGNLRRGFHDIQSRQRFPTAQSCHPLHERSGRRAEHESPIEGLSGREIEAQCAANGSNAKRIQKRPTPGDRTPQNQVGSHLYFLENHTRR